MLRNLAAVLAFTGLASSAAAQMAAPTSQVTVELTAPGAGPVSGRLLLRAYPKPAPTMQLPNGQTMNVAVLPVFNASPMAAPSQWMGAQDVSSLAPGQTLAINTAQLAYPSDISAMPPGVYVMQAMLDVNGNAGYSASPDAGDLYSQVQEVTLPLAQPLKIALARQSPNPPAWDDTSWLGSRLKPAAEAAKSHMQMVDVPSPLQTAFHGKPIAIRALVVTPPGYEAGSDRYPVVFYFDGFGGRLGQVSLAGAPQKHYTGMASGKEPPMIWVFFDQEINGGAHAFADSASNGPWGQSLTTEFIPWLDKTYRTDGKASGRFVAGHSTGGWAALWQQVKYPSLYGGAFATAPDYVDFRRAWETNLYAPGANVYAHASGEPKFISRSRADQQTPVERYTRIEGVISASGGQIRSFDWVFSPRGPDGLPLPLFDHRTGAVDPKVAEAWKAYDISRILEDSWTSGGSEIAKKLHIAVGSADTYYLNEAVELMDANFKRRGAAGDIQVVANKDHTSILSNGNSDTHWRITEQAWAMYAIARPGVQRPAPAAPQPVATMPGGGAGG